MNALQRFYKRLLPGSVESRSATGVGLTSVSEWRRYFYGTNDSLSVTEDSALRLSAVWACVKVISEAIASLPWQVYENTPAGKSIANMHPLYALLHDQPHPWYTSYTFRETLMLHVLLWGNAYARIYRGRNERPYKFEILMPHDVTVNSEEGELIYTTPAGRVHADDMIHLAGLGFDGVQGKSPIRTAADNLGVSLHAQRFGKNFFQNGAHLTGVLEHPGKLSQTAKENIKGGWKEQYGGIDKVGETAVLEEGMKYNRIGIPPEDAQFIQTRKFGVAEIARIYTVPLHKIGDLERSTNNNIEHQDLEFVKYTLLPWQVRIEQEFNRKAFRIDDVGRYFNKLNVNGLLRGDIQARSNFYRTMWNIGVMSQNDIRELEDMNPIPEKAAGKYYAPVNMAPVEKLGTQMQPANTEPKL